MNEVQPFDIVRLLSGLPEYGVPAGARAVVLEVHSEPYEAYEVEVVDDLGQTVFTGAVEPAQCEIEVVGEPPEPPGSLHRPDVGEEPDSDTRSPSREGCEPGCCS